MKKFSLFFLLIFIPSFLFSAQINGNKTRPSSDQIRKDFDAKNFAPYVDSFSVIDKDALVKRGVISNASQLENNTSVSSLQDIRTLLSCDIGTNEKWTSTAYDFDMENGTLTCLVAPSGDINNPVGVFKIVYPKVAAFFSKDLAAAKTHEAAAITTAKQNFDAIYQKIRDKQHEVAAAQQGGQSYLTLTDMLTSTILTDTSVVDVEMTRDTGKLTFRTGVNIAGGNNNLLVIDDAETIFGVYAGLSDVSMHFFVYILTFFALFGLGKTFLPMFSDKIEGKEHMEKKIPYIFGMIAGALLFLPTIQFDKPIETPSTENNKVLGDYDIMQTKWQDFERNGYKLFSAWADAAARVIIDEEMKSIINKSGVGTEDQIINNYAGKIKYEHMLAEAQALQGVCNSSYDIDGSMKQESDNGSYGYVFSDNSSTVFPTNENWAYAEGLYNNYNNYYALAATSTAYSPTAQSSYSTLLSNAESAIPSLEMSYFPQVSLAFCGKNYFKIKDYKNKLDSYTKTLALLKSGSGSDEGKIAIIRGLVDDQYQLYNDWGFLSILGLPVIKMETEMLGGLYKNGNSAVLEKLNKEIASKSTGGSMIHSLFSSIPYMFVPGAGTVFTVVNENAPALVGGAAASIFSFIPGIGTSIGAVAGAIVGKVAGAGIAAKISYEVAVTILQISPIIGIILIGLLRFIIIIIKMFGLHFAALFVLPVAFAKENISSISKFVMKVFATMIELPLFVLGIWLAVTANGLIHSIGDVFSKKIILMMLDNNAITGAFDLNDKVTWLMTLKLYMFDGFMEVVIAVFSIVLIYKIIVTFHNSFLDAMEIQGSRVLDDAVDSMRSESGQWGAKV